LLARTAGRRIKPSADAAQLGRAFQHQGRKADFAHGDRRRRPADAAADELDAHGGW
jgi:hypothetical protein